MPRKEVMFAQPLSAAAVYGRVAVETGIADARPVQLLIMVYEGAIEALARAAALMRSGDVAAKNAAITRAIRIIDEGLKATLDHRAGDIGARLAELYDYMTHRLLLANLRGDAALIDEVRELLVEIKSAWDEVAGRELAQA